MRDSPTATTIGYSPQDSDSPVALVERWVEEGLNQRNVGVIGELLAPTFRDHDPLSLSGILTPSQYNWGRIDDMYNLVRLLASPIADFNFSIVEIFGTTQSVAYRLFAAGILRLLNESEITSVTSTVAGVGDHYGLAPAEGFARILGSQEFPRVVEDRLHLAIECTGIFRAINGQLVERWGPFVMLPA